MERKKSDEEAKKRRRKGWGGKTAQILPSSEFEATLPRSFMSHFVISFFFPLLPFNSILLHNFTLPISIHSSTSSAKLYKAWV
jgi:nitrate reductase gamma subunit